jgi:signal transduction histidine kinase
MIARVGRPQAAIVIVLVWILVCGGLAWATFSAIQLEEVEARTKKQKDIDETISLAISRLDNHVLPILERERSRPYTHFRPFYAVANPLDGADYSQLTKAIKLESPLRHLPDHSGWLLLHFQASEVEGWSSPQLEGAVEQAMPASVFPAADRDRQASAANWLAAMKESYTPYKLQQMLEQYLAFNRVFLGPGDNKPVAQSVRGDAAPNAATDFVRGAERLLQLEREQGVLCEPETVALGNLQAGEGRSGKTPGTACVQMVPTRMIPIWLELTLDDRLQLAMVKSWSVETSQYCTLQGVLLDWEKIRKDLEEQIGDRVKGAKLIPVRADTHIPFGLLGSMMQNLPVRLEIPADAYAEVSLSTGLRIGLALAWLTALLGLGAVTYGTLKFITLAERKMQFVAAVTHELRTPLTSFQLYSDLLMDMPDEDGNRRRQYAESLRSEAKRLARLVENVLAYSRINVMGPKLQWQEMGAGEILESARNICAVTCSQAGKEIVIENRCDSRTRIHTDSEFVQQILVNLIENACKYSNGAPDRRIWLCAAPNLDGSVTFEVDDAGPGVAHAERQTVFQPFRRSEVPTSRQAGGIGLGLAMSKYWAQCLGGRLTLKRSSRNGSHYSCFALNLPLAPEKELA